MSRKIPFAFLLLGILSIATQSSFAQADPPLNFGANYFVTGDYVVAGAQGLNASFGSDGFGTGTISFPDGNPGIRGATTVPKGANIVAAILYWQTVEKVNQLGTGQNGFFGPVFNGKPQLYPISGFNVPSHDAVSFSNGGCSGTSTGKLVRTYRTDVRGYLPLDANGNVLVNSADGVTFEVRLPNVGLNDPYTLGATLVLIYRVNSPNIPLNVITIYEGPFAPNTTPNFTMSQLVPFYQAANSPVSKLTHIVGAGKNNKFQQAYLGGGQGGNQRAATALPSPYGNGQPAFPGHYVNWDNTTWVFPDPTFPNHPNLANPLEENDDSATAMVVASGANPGCVSWSATIVGTTVHDDDKDGILQVFKKNQGYTDIATGEHVDLTGAEPGQQDVFIQMDHVVDSNGDFTPDMNAVMAVQNAFLAHGVHLHISGGNAIQEPAVTDGSPSCNGGLCPYPNQVGITTWRDGFEIVKNQPLNYATEALCEANSPPLVPIGPGNCVRRFPPAQRNTHHYVVWGDTLGGPNWTFLGGRLTDSTGTGNGLVEQANNTITFYTTRGHGLKVDANAGSGRVTIANAATNPSLNGTHLVTSVNCPQNPDTNLADDCSVGNRALGPYTFTITIGGTARMANYTLQTDPYIAVASGQAGAGSGFSDVGGAGTLITLGQWGADATLQAKEGTFMHELGHTLGLQHGGGDSINCKSNYQSVMNYMYQASLLGPTGTLDFSSQQLSSLNESSLGPITTTDMSKIAFPTTKWYDTQQTLAFKVATITSFAINSNVVTFYANNNFKAGDMVQISGLTVGTYLNTPLNGSPLTVLAAGLTNMQFEASFTYANVPLTVDSGTAKTTTPVPTGDAASHHCDGSSLAVNDPPTYKYAGGTNSPSDEISIPWSTSPLDANFIPGTGPNFVGYNDWANADYRQVGAGANDYFSLPGGFVPGGPGGFVPGGPGGFVPGGPGGFVPGGPGGFVPGGPGGFVPGGPGITGNTGTGKGELDFATAVSTIDPPTNLTASEEPSARIIDLSWNALTFPHINQYNIYRSADQGTTFSFLKSVAGPQAQDNPTCNPAGYQYFVTAVYKKTATITSFAINSNVVTFQAANNFTAGDIVQISGLTVGTYLNGQVLTVISTGLSGTQFEANFTHANVGSTADSGTAVSTKESARSNIVSTGQSGELLTGCYGPTGFNLSAPANAVQGSFAAVTWNLQDLTNQSGFAVSRLKANTSLAAIGPIMPTSLGGPCPPFPANPPAPISLLTNGVANEGQSTFSVGAGPNYQFTYNLDTDPLAAGCYFFKLVLDSGQSQTTASALQLAIDVNDTDSTPHIATVALPAGTVGLLYNPNNILTEDGGTAPFTWTFTGSLPTGIALNLSTGVLSGTTCVAGNYSFTAMVTDSKKNSGTQPLTLQINQANTTTTVAANANPSVFQQTVTFTVTVKPQYTCTPTGNVTLFADGSQIGLTTALNSGTATFTFTPSTLSVGMHNITATYAGDSNFTGSNSTILVQTVNKASTQTTINSVLPSPATVGQPTTVSYTFGVVLPGTGAPTAPSGTLIVTGSDGSSCMPAPAAVQGSGGCVLYPITAGTTTFTVTYPGDGNFVNSGANGNDTVNIYVSDTAPPAAPPFIPTTTLPNGVVGTPYSNTVYESGGVPDGVTPFKWTIKPGSVTLNGSPVLSIPGLSFQPNTIAANNGTFSGTPTAPGMYTFTAQVTDAPGNTGTQTFTLTVADALFGDLIVVDGASTAGMLFRVTPTGTAGTIAAISNGSPTGVAVDSTSGNIYVAVAPVSGSGTARIVRIGPSGTIGDPFISGGVFTNPVAVAVDGSGNVYLGDNSTNAIYKFTSSGTQVDASGNPTANPFASLPTSSGLPNHIRMAVDTSGNLDVASDSIGGFSGQIEVDEFALSTAAKTVLYNTTANGTYSVTSIASNASGGSTTYTGTFSPTLPVGSSVTIAGFSNAGNNGTFTVQSCSSTQLTVNNGSGVAEIPATAGTATIQLTVGGIVVLPADGSIDLADYGTQAIYNIANPGTVSIAIGPTASLCCNISGMANPPSGGANTNLYVALTGAKSTTPQLQLAVPSSSVTTDNSTLTYSLTAAGTASGGNTTYTGAFSPTIPANAQVTIAGFTNAADNGPFTVVSCTSTTLVVSNASGVAETNPATAVVATPLTFPNDVAWYSKH